VFSECACVYFGMLVRHECACFGMCVCIFRNVSASRNVHVFGMYGGRVRISECSEVV